MKKVSLLIYICMAFAEVLFAKTITGKVSDRNNNALPGVSVIVRGTQVSTETDTSGTYQIEANEGDVLQFSLANYETRRFLVARDSSIHVILIQKIEIIVEETEIITNAPVIVRKPMNFSSKSLSMSHSDANYATRRRLYGRPPTATESYAHIAENSFKSAQQSPVSTFSIDVDAAGYSNMRRFILNGQRPPKDAVRVEEMINYFNYEYPQPKGNHPFSITTELGNCPWNAQNKLVHIGLQGKHLSTKEASASNLVFLIDVSGSMGAANKLPLLKKAYRLLVNQLRKKDRLAIVVYAGSSGVVLPSTPGDEKEIILKALDNLQSGGSTAGAAGLKLAYQVAEANFIEGGNNRIILATDGDFNVGQSSDQDLEKLIVEHRDKGIFMSVTGFGMGNYKDSKMEIIADKGNGNYSYIDTILEAKKVFINEFGSTLFTIAKDVKIQIEFNPAHVAEYRLIGYENRLLNNEDFNNDKKDAGELGAGHTVTALYEIIPATQEIPGPVSLKYQTINKAAVSTLASEFATVKFRYKKPKASKSILLEKVITNTTKTMDQISENFRFSGAVASFGMLLKESEFKGDLTYSTVLEMAQSSKGPDQNGYRSEFIELVKLAAHL